MSNSYISLEDRIEELKKQGLIVDDEEEAKSFLLYNNRRRLRKYIALLSDQGKFLADTTFENISHPYIHDRKLRHAISLYMEIVEVGFKSVYCEEFSKVHGETGYLDPAFFSDPLIHKEIMDKADKQRSSKAKYDGTYRYREKDGTPRLLPIGDFVELLTIKDITDLYAISEKSIKKKVADRMGYPNGGQAIFERAMRGLTFLRNQCAHGYRLYDLVFPIKAQLSKKEKRLLAKRPDGKPDNSHLFGYILIMKRMLPKDDFREFKNILVSLAAEFPLADMKYYGFPPNWEKVL